MEKTLFGTGPMGCVDAYTLKNEAGMAVTVLTLGGIVQKLAVPTADGPVDVCLGYDTVAEYLSGTNYFGALIGRNGNRIAGASFELNGKTCTLAANNGRHNLHGGAEGGGGGQGLAVGLYNEIPLLQARGLGRCAQGVVKARHREAVGLQLQAHGSPHRHQGLGSQHRHGQQRQEQTEYQNAT